MKAQSRLHRQRHSESGNVLFIILIGIVLFGALTFSVTRGSRDSGSTSKESAALAAADIMGYGARLENAVNTVMIGGTPDNKISFENSTISGYTNASAATKDKIFDAAGGGVLYEAPRADWLDSANSASVFYGQWYFPANVCVPNLGTGSTTCNSDTLTTTEDIVVILPYIKQEVCEAINRKVGIPSCSGSVCANAAKVWPTANTKFTGTFADDVAIHDSTGAGTDGFGTGCVRGNGTAPWTSTSYYFYKVLSAR